MKCRKKRHKSAVSKAVHTMLVKLPPAWPDCDRTALLHANELKSVIIKYSFCKSRIRETKQMNISMSNLVLKFAELFILVAKKKEIGKCNCNAVRSVLL